jgi:hypothetical protein
MARQPDFSLGSVRHHKQEPILVEVVVELARPVFAHVEADDDDDVAEAEVSGLSLTKQVFNNTRIHSVIKIHEGGCSCM